MPITPQNKHYNLIFITPAPYFINIFIKNNPYKLFFSLGDKLKPFPRLKLFHVKQFAFILLPFPCFIIRLNVKMFHVKHFKLPYYTQNNVSRETIPPKNNYFGGFAVKIGLNP